LSDHFQSPFIINIITTLRSTIYIKHYRASKKNLASSKLTCHYYSAWNISLFMKCLLIL